MARRPAFPTPCAHPGCTALTRDRHCPEHKPEANKAEWQHRKGKLNRKVYNSRRWRDRVQPAYLAAHPFCVRCECAGRITVSELVHHIVPIEPPHNGDPWSESNFEALCWSCHGEAESEANRKTA